MYIRKCHFFFILNVSNISNVSLSLDDSDIVGKTLI